MGETKYKTCPICGKTLPLNRKFFKRNSDGTFHDACRYCDDKEKRNAEWNGNLLKCHICGKYLPVDKFSHTDHYPYRDNHDARCTDCKTKQMQEVREKYDDETRLAKILRTRFYAARERAKKKGLDFDLTIEFLKELWEKQDGKCAITKLPMTFLNDNGRVYTNVSIDQIEPNAGYIKKNIQLVCMAVNQLKSDLTMNEVLTICKSIVENYNEK